MTLPSLPTQGSTNWYAWAQGVQEAAGSVDPVLAGFTYDPATGDLLSYTENGVTITLTYNADGTVATSRRGAGPIRTYSYDANLNLIGVA